MLSTLSIKLALTAGIVGLVGAGYLYVSDLQNDKQKLIDERTVLVSNNEKLETEIKDQQRLDDIVTTVNGLANDVRTENRVIRDTQYIQIDNHVKQGKDREVGPLLKDFLNGK